MGNQFAESRRKEILGLLNKKVFEPVHRKEAEGHHIFGCRFVDEIKNNGLDNAYEKSRLVVPSF